MSKTQIKRKFGILLGVAIVATAGVLAVGHFSKPPKTVINSQSQSADFSAGRVSGDHQGQPNELKTTGALTYQSPEVSTNQPKTNVVGFSWAQQGGGHAHDQQAHEEPTRVEARTFDGRNWTDWAQLGSTDDRKDGTAALHTAVLVTENAQKVQYRFAMNSRGDPISVKDLKLTYIDATRGPDPTKQTAFQKVFGIAQAATRPAGPRIFSRAEWGCPEATSSPRWEPEYRALGRVVVHHTAAVHNGVNSAAAVRGIWDFHANKPGNDWGDIGYNYLVDVGGNAFQGRHYDHAFAQATNTDVVGGHAFGHNYGTTGIAAIGNFTNQGVGNGMLDSIGLVAGWKSATYPFNPGDGANLVGHRDVGQTNCPGNNLHSRLNHIRVVSSNWHNEYMRRAQFAYAFVRQGVSNPISLRPGQTASAFVDLRNDSETAWANSGPNPTRLGTGRPLDRASAFYHNSWLAPSRAGTFTQEVDGAGNPSAASTIQPGETGRFSFTFQMPNTGGSYQEYFQLVKEGVGWHADLGVYWQINVVGDVFTYQWMDQTYGVPPQPTATGPISVTIKNTGNVAWSKTGPNPVRLATDRPRDRASNLYHSSWLSGNRVTSFTGKASLNGSGQLVRDGSGNVIYDTGATSIEPGEAATFVFTGQAPNRPFAGNEYFNFVVEGRGWMNDVGLYWPVNMPQGYHVQWVGQSGPATINKSTNPFGSIYFDFKNTGSFTWQKNGIVRLGTANPLDWMNDGFFATGLSGGQLPPYSSNWLARNRVDSFAGKVTGGVFDESATTIAPGETGRFYIALDARNVAVGDYREDFRPVADGWAWLEDYGIWLTVRVRP